jgi:hypothetical protein
MDVKLGEANRPRVFENRELAEENIWTYRGRKQQEDGENCIMRTFIRITLHHIITRIIKSRGWDWQNM